MISSKNKMGVEGYHRNPDGSKKKVIKAVNVDQIMQSGETFSGTQYHAMTHLASQQQYDPTPLEEVKQGSHLGTYPWRIGMTSGQTSREPESNKSKMSISK